MITRQRYVEYLISTFGNYTESHLAEHLGGVSHDVVTDYLRSERLTSRSLWELVGPLISDGPDSFLILDDSVQDKRYSRFIELVKRQYSGAEHGLVRGSGVVNLVHSGGVAGDFWPLDFRNRGLKQLTGSEKCQCRKARSQRNHLTCCYHAWLSLKVKAKQLNKTLYQVKTDLLCDYLRAELRNARIPAFQPGLSESPTAISQRLAAKP